MKIIKKWTVVAIVLITFFSSCTYEKVYPVEEVYVDSYTKNFTVKISDWHIGTDDESGNYFYYEFAEPNLTQTVYDFGVMIAYLRMNDGNLTPLPFNDYWKEGEYMWTEQVTVEFRPGYVTFILKYSDHATNITPYYDYMFRVRFMW